MKKRYQVKVSAGPGKAGIKWLGWIDLDAPGEWRHPAEASGKLKLFMNADDAGDITERITLKAVREAGCVDLITPIPGTREHVLRFDVTERDSRGRELGPADLKYTEYGHVVGENGKPLTDPYEHISWSVGNGDDFVCFDAAIATGSSGAKHVVLHATVNSETGSFIDTFVYEVVKPEAAEWEALGIIDRALEWAYENQLRFNKRDSAKSARGFLRHVQGLVATLGPEVGRQVAAQRKQRGTPRVYA